jgi:CheY-like chemotaxis protein
MTESRKRVLIVEDDGPTRMLEAVVLREAGYVVAEARDGDVAIRQLDAGPPDLVVLDLRLPGVDGWGVIEHITQMPIRPRIVVVTGMPDVRAPDHLQPYVGDVVTKPFAAPELLAVCARVLTV